MPGCVRVYFMVGRFFLTTLKVRVFSPFYGVVPMFQSYPKTLIDLYTYIPIYLYTYISIYVVLRVILGTKELNDVSAPLKCGFLMVL